MAKAIEDQRKKNNEKGKLRRKLAKAGKAIPTRVGKAVVSKRDLTHLEVFQVACTAPAGKVLSCIGGVTLDEPSTGLPGGLARGNPAMGGNCRAWATGGTEIA
jgi:hypothetical protein